LCKTDLFDRLTGSCRPRTSHSCESISAAEELAESQESKPHMHLSTRKIARHLKIFQTTVLHIIHDDHFMFHIMLDAAGVILRVHYKSMKCDVSFSQDSVSAMFI